MHTQTCVHVEDCYFCGKRAPFSVVQCILGNMVEGSAGLPLVSSTVITRHIQALVRSFLLLMTLSFLEARITSVKGSSAGCACKLSWSFTVSSFYLEVYPYFRAHKASAGSGSHPSNLPVLTALFQEHTRPLSGAMIFSCADPSLTYLSDTR